MKSWITLSSVLLFCPAAVTAAGLAPPFPAPGYIGPPPVFSWSGFYAGANAGYVFDGDHTYLTRGDNSGPAQTVQAIASGARPGFFRVRSDGFSGGGQIGYNYQLRSLDRRPGLMAGGTLVAGVEADAAYTGLNGSGTYVDSADPTHVSNFRSKTGFIGTLRGRLGYAAGAVLIYGTGGLAYGSVTDRVTFSGLGLNNFAGSADALRAGYAYGGGIEYAFAGNSVLNAVKASAVTFRAEYVHYDLGINTIRLSGTSGSVNSYTTRLRADGDLVRFGLNYKLNPMAAFQFGATY